MQKQAAAVHMAQKVVPQANAVGRAFDEAGMSAATKLASGPTRTTPSTGEKEW